MENFCDYPLSSRVATWFKWMVSLVLALRKLDFLSNYFPDTCREKKGLKKDFDGASRPYYNFIQMSLYQ